MSTKMPMPQAVVSALQPVTREQMIYIWRELMDTLPGWDIVSRLSTFLKELIYFKVHTNSRQKNVKTSLKQSKTICSLTYTK